MKHERYRDLLEEMPRISKAVNEFKSEAVQQAAFELLVATLGLEQGLEMAGGDEKRDRAPAKKKSKRAGRAVPRDEETPAGREPQEVVNQLKQRADFEKISAIVFHKRDLWNKVRLLLLQAEEGMTSGEVTKVLHGLNVKTSLSSVSRSLKENSSSLLSAEARKVGLHPRYRLSAPARTEALKWLDEVVS